MNIGVVSQDVESDTFKSVCASFRQGLVLFFENMASELQRGMERERLGSEQSIGPGNKK